MKHFPNIITVLRVVCVPWFALAVMRENFHLAFYLACLMSISDALDGFLAKRFSWETKLGEYLDPLADKFLLLTAFILLHQLALLPLWVIVIVLGRDALIVAGCIMLRYLYGETDFRPHWTGKVSTFLQFIMIMSLLVGQITPLPEIVVPFLTNCVTVTAVASGIVYTAIGWHLRGAAASRQYNL